MHLRLGLAATITALSVVAASAAERAIIVMDGSGSMWGQISGRAKIEIARETLGEVLRSIPADTELGLIAYGHREKGQCSDIELMVPASPGTAGAIATAVGSITPKGKTPLSEAVRQAAEALRYTEEKATVILITDGLETCNADPCALARELERSGVDFTAHVVGFGLSREEGREVACLAENTGGLYIGAADAAELVEALSQTVAAPAAPPAPAPTASLPEASLTAPDAAEISAVVVVGWQGPGEVHDRIELWDPNALAGDGKRLRSVALRNGDMDARTVRMPLPATAGNYELRYFHGESRAALATRPIVAVPVAVVLIAPDQVSLGKIMTIEWIGPGAQHDAIELWDPAALGGEGKSLNRIALRNGDYDARNVDMPAPAEPGPYELRYLDGQDRKVLASRPVEVTDAVVRLEVEDPLPAGTPVVIDWIGPGGRRDEIQLWDPAAKGGDGERLFSKNLRNDDFANQRLTLPGPAEAGTYELRYWQGDYRKVLAVRPLEITGVDVALDAPATIEAGNAIKVAWTGPGARRDEIQLWDPAAKGGDGERLFSKNLRNDDFENRTLTLPGPAEAGLYELRYWNGDNRTVMATRAIEVTAAAVGLDAPATVEAGRTIRIAWAGPGARRDEIQLWDPAAKGGDGERLFSKNLRNDDYDNRTLTLPAPAEAGTYELRYWNGDNRAVMVTRPIEVTAAVVALDAPDQLGQGHVLKVTWQGPGAKRDEIQVWDPAAKGGDGERLFSINLRNGDYDNRQVTLPSPVQPGSYEIRYWNGDSRAVMAARRLEIVPIEISLSGPDAVETGTRFAVVWAGPGARRDEVQIYDPGTDKVLARMNLRNSDYDNNRATLKAPDQAGNFVLRYWNGDNRAVLAEAPITVQ